MLGSRLTVHWVGPPENLPCQEVPALEPAVPNDRRFRRAIECSDQRGIRKFDGQFPKRGGETLLACEDWLCVFPARAILHDSVGKCKSYRRLWSRIARNEITRSRGSIGLRSRIGCGQAGEHSTATPQTYPQEKGPRPSACAAARSPRRISVRMLPARRSRWRTGLLPGAPLCVPVATSKATWLPDRRAAADT